MLQEMRSLNLKLSMQLKCSVSVHQNNFSTKTPKNVKYVLRLKEQLASSKHHAKAVVISGSIQKTIPPLLKLSSRRNFVLTLRRCITYQLLKELKLPGLRQKEQLESRLNVRQEKEQLNKRSLPQTIQIKDHRVEWNREKLVLIRCFSQ